MSKDNSNFFKKKNEWSVIKDKLLGCYLTPYFQKVLRTGKPICYVDCFAGKGMFDDGTEGSPLIALKTRESCLQLTKIRDKHGAIKTRFIELNHVLDEGLETDYFQRLPYGDFNSVVQGIEINY